MISNILYNFSQNEFCLSHGKASNRSSCAKIYSKYKAKKPTKCYIQIDDRNHTYNCLLYPLNLLNKLKKLRVTYSYSK